MRGSGQRLPITLRFTRVLGTFSHTTCFPFSCALWACFSDRSVSGERSEPIGALMPHAALWVVQLQGISNHPKQEVRFQCRTRLCGWCSMDLYCRRYIPVTFQCRTRLCGWCSLCLAPPMRSNLCFNAARGFVGGAATKQTCCNLYEKLFQCRTRLCGWCSSTA